MPLDKWGQFVPIDPKQLEEWKTAAAIASLPPNPATQSEVLLDDQELAFMKAALVAVPALILEVELLHLELAKEKEATKAAQFRWSEP